MPDTAPRLNYCETCCDKDLPLITAQSGSSLSTVARAKTLTVLGILDGARKGSVLQFLYESVLIYKEHILLDESNLIEKHYNIVSLSNADLRGAVMTLADLSRADLSRADLSDAKVTDEQLEQAESLIGATMPNGQKYEDWLKDREGGKEDAENA